MVIEMRRESPRQGRLHLPVPLLMWRTTNKQLSKKFREGDQASEWKSSSLREHRNCFHFLYECVDRRQSSPPFIW